MLNGMMVTRGSRHDYDMWADMGNTGWGWEDVLPYFKKLETVSDPEYLKSGLNIFSHFFLQMCCSCIVYYVYCIN